MATRPLKRLNRLRKLGNEQSLEDYFRTNLRQNWKAIEDTLSDIERSVIQVRSKADILAASGKTFISGNSGMFSTGNMVVFANVSNLVFTAATISSAFSYAILPEGGGESRMGNPAEGSEFRVLRGTDVIGQFSLDPGEFLKSYSGVAVGKAPGTEVFRFQARRLGTSDLTVVENVRLVVTELQL